MTLTTATGPTAPTTSTPATTPRPARRRLAAVWWRVVEGLATDNGWCWAACTWGPLPAALARSAGRYPDDDRGRY